MKQVRTADLEPQPDLGAPALLREDRGQVALLTLNRPEARNCLSEDMIASLHSAIAEIGSSDAVRAIVVTGSGSAFSSGHDLKELSAHRNDPDRGKAYFAKIMGACSKMMLSIVRSPKPVIAAVNGIATAAGCQLVASCDLAVASEDARFATPGVNIGLFCSTPIVVLSRNDRLWRADDRQHHVGACSHDLGEISLAAIGVVAMRGKLLEVVAR
jgi:enoyl-CoA hydratase/carnithine racemase